MSICIDNSVHCRLQRRSLHFQCIYLKLFTWRSGCYWWHDIFYCLRLVYSWWSSLIFNDIRIKGVYTCFPERTYNVIWGKLFCIWPWSQFYPEIIFKGWHAYEFTFTIKMSLHWTLDRKSQRQVVVSDEVNVEEVQTESNYFL